MSVFKIYERDYGVIIRWSLWLPEVPGVFLVRFELMGKKQSSAP